MLAILFLVGFVALAFWIVFSVGSQVIDHVEEGREFDLGHPRPRPRRK